MDVGRDSQPWRRRSMAPVFLAFAEGAASAFVDAVVRLGFRCCWSGGSTASE